MDYKNALIKPKPVDRPMIYAYEARLVAEHIKETGGGRVGKRVDGVCKVINRAVHGSMQNGLFSFEFTLPDPKTSWGDAHTDLLSQKLGKTGYKVKAIDGNKIEVSW